MPEKLLTDKEVADMTGLSRMTLLRLRKKGQLAFYVMADGRTIRYAPKHIDAYLKSRERPSRERAQRAHAA